MQFNLLCEPVNMNHKRKPRIGYNGYKHIHIRTVKILSDLGDDDRCTAEYYIRKLEGKMKWR